MFKPDETIEMEKHIVLCVADWSIQHVAILSQTILKCLCLPHECLVSQTTHLSWMISTEPRGIEKNYGWIMESQHSSNHCPSMFRGAMIGSHMLMHLKGRKREQLMRR